MDAYDVPQNKYEWPKESLEIIKGSFLFGEIVYCRVSYTIFLKRRLEILNN